MAIKIGQSIDTGNIDEEKHIYVFIH